MNTWEYPMNQINNTDRQQGYAALIQSVDNPLEEPILHMMNLMTRQQRIQF
ncbi:16127_t:CDS:2 [Racocetra persica]|uniref:16127_t:CDS:1 n=1 Tax=Racocetra persica TaxID=160502 RepID=A0ACA9LU79_9GLOM|nr:16127_t:CDS:2 [Racocetra persica]